jgi:bisphosphoglycerate-dependent phosphoglycerate mutase
MYIENISKEDIVKLEIQTGVPRTYEYENNIFTKTN